MFEDLESSMVHDLHIDGKSDKEILTIINDKQITEKKKLWSVLSQSKKPKRLS